MRLQSAIEFLSTYGFMFLVLTLAIALVLFLASYNGTAPTTQCNSYGTLYCNYVNFYPNTTYGYGILTFTIANGQNTPININSVNATLDNYTRQGACSPTFMYPAQESTCLVSYPTNALTATLHNGIYNVQAGFCSSGVSMLNISSCTYANVIYTGSFQVYNNPNDTTPFSVIVASIPYPTQLPALPASPQIPANYLIVQNGDLVALRNLTGMGYAFGTGSYQANSFFGMNVLPFPTVLSTANTNTIACGPSSYNSLLTMSYGMFYKAATSNVLFQAFGDNSIEIYYKLNTSASWSNAFNGLGWVTNSLTTHTATKSLIAGTYQLAVAWVNTCTDGAQAISVNGIGQ